MPYDSQATQSRTFHTLSQEEIVLKITADPKTHLEIEAEDGKFDVSLLDWATMDKELNAKEKTCIPHGIQLSWMDLIKKGHITKIEFYSSAFSVRYEEVYETPITQLSQGSLISITPGFRAEHSYTLIIPYDAYQDLGDLPHMVHLKSDENQKTIASWKIDITDSKIDIETPAQMSCNSFRTHLV